MTFTHGITVTVERPGGTDQFGNKLPGATHTIPGCAPAPAGSTEEHHQESTVEWDLDLLVPYAADITPVDVVLLPGDTTRYQVHGKPKAYRSPFTGWEAGTIVRLKAAT